MVKIGAHRGLTALAMLRLSEKDLRSFHELISEMNGTVFLEIVRDLEDEVENSMTLVLDRTREQSSFSSEFNDLYLELDRIRRHELRIPVHQFADALAESVAKSVANNISEIPNFDSRRGLQAWLKKLVRRFSESDVYHAAMRIRYEKRENKDSDWKLR